jgi:malonate transporter
MKDRGQRVDGVLKGFVVVGIVLLIGYILARTRTLGPAETKALSTLTFTVGLPSLMFSVIGTSHISDVLSPTGLVAVLSALAVMSLFIICGFIARWGVRRTTVGALATGIVNSTNLGVPLSLYILGSATYVTPIMLFQLSILTPIALTVLDLTNPTGARTSISRILLTPFRNPVTVAAILGILVSAGGLEIPPFVLEPTKLLAQLTVPLMLLIFGMSLYGLSAGSSRADRAPTTVAVILKSAAHPLIAWVLAVYVFDLGPFETFVVTACAILPTGQNVVLYAVRYDVGRHIAQPAAIITSALAIPLLLGAAWVLG